MKTFFITQSFLRKFLFAWCCIAAAGINFTQAQCQKKWVVYNKLVNVSVANPVVTTLPTIPTNSPVSNGVYSTTGALIFYVNNFNIYDAGGNSISYIPFGSPPCEQIPICKVPGTTNQYYVIYSISSPSIPAHLYYSKIQVNGTTPVAVVGQQNIQFDPVGYYQTVQMAIRQEYEGVSKFLYVLPLAGSLEKFNITSSGITLAQSFSNSLTSISSELELSRTGTKSAAAAFSTIKIFTLDQCTGDLISSTTYSAPDNAKGLEFNDAGDHLFVSTASGIFDLEISSSSFASVTSNTSFVYSFIERAYNGKMYVANGSGLSSFNQTSPYNFALNSVPFSNSMTFFGTYPLPCQNDFGTGIGGADKEYIPCCPATVIIGKNAKGNCSYSWSPILGLSDPNIAQPIASPVNTTTYTLTRDCGGCILTDQVTVNVPNGPCCKVGEQEVEDEQSALLYPNPSSGIFTIENSSPENSILQVEVLDLPGNVIYQSGSLAPGETRDVSLTNFSKGYYFCRIHNSTGKIQILKVVIL